MRQATVAVHRYVPVSYTHLDVYKRQKYMFPKAHAAAYVMMAWRIAWFKVFKPLAYYAAFFSIRATAFSYETMCMGRDRLDFYLAELRKKGDAASKKEQDTIKDMRIVQEMYARGLEFMPIDLYRAKANRFQIIDGKLMPDVYKRQTLLSVLNRLTSISSVF